VLQAIEGHFISGYADGGDVPDKQLQLVPGALPDAEAFLENHPEVRARFDRVTDLVEGFETPFGLELLSTVHWVANRSRSTQCMMSLHVPTLGEIANGGSLSGNCSSY